MHYVSKDVPYTTSSSTYKHKHTLAAGGETISALYRILTCMRLGQVTAQLIYLFISSRDSRITYAIMRQRVLQ